MVSFILNVIINYFNLIHFFRVAVDRAVYTMTKMPLMFFEKLMTFTIRSCLNLTYAQRQWLVQTTILHI